MKIKKWTVCSRLYLEYFFNMEDTAATFSIRYWDNSGMDSFQQAQPRILLPNGGYCGNILTQVLG
jgi:hypothetical protein